MKKIFSKVLGNLVKKEDPLANSPLVETYGQYPMELERGKGIFVYDTEGKEYIDFYGGHAVSLLGHSPESVVDAIAEQGKKFMFYSNLARIPIRAEGAGALIDFADNDFSRVFFCNSGAEANENALKVAIKSTGRSKIIAFKGAFHGRTAIAMGATDSPKWHKIYQPWLGPVIHFAANDESAISAVDEETAAVILEPIQSIGGVVQFSEDYLKLLRQKTKKVGAKLIFDEVQTGMGRLGVPFVSGHWGVQPDMASSAKGIATGFAMGAVLMTEETASEVEVGDIAATFGGGPMAVAAMMATLSEIKEKDLVNNAKLIGEYVKAKFVGENFTGVRGKGCLLGIELKTSAKEIQKKLFTKGFITGTCSDPNVLHLLPPLTIQKEQIDKLHRAVIEVLNDK